MLVGFSKRVSFSKSLCPSSSVGLQRRYDSGIGSAAQVKNLEVTRRHERVGEILNKVKNRDGLFRLPSHIEHLVGRVTQDSSKNDDTSAGHKDMAGMDLADKTQQILQSDHPVRYILERELYNTNTSTARQTISHHTWITLFGRGIRISKNPKYEEILNNIAKASDSGMFSSDIHQTVVDIPENYQPVATQLQFSLGNKYAALVGDYFAIRCIYFIEKTKSSKALMAITKGVGEFATAYFAVELIDKKIIYPMIPHSKAGVNDWILYNKKASGYLNGGLYAALLENYDGLPDNEEFMKHMKKFSSSLAVLLKGVAEIDAMEHAQDFSTVSPFSLTSLPAILYQQKNPGAFDKLRQSQFQLNLDEFKQLMEEIERSSVVHEAKFLLGDLALEAKRSFRKISKDDFYSDVIQDLVEAITTFD